MCGRFARTSSVEQYQQMLDLEPGPSMELTPRYNILPSQTVLAFRTDVSGGIKPVQLQWPYIPPFERQPRTKLATINAKSEAAARSRLWREPIRQRRCLIAADGFYEPLDVGIEKRKPQFYFTRHDREPFFFAGLWGQWTGGGRTIDSCAIMTTDANPDVASVHPRMPVMVRPEHYSLWLDKGVTDPEQLQAVYEPYSAGTLDGWLVGFYTREDNPAVIEPADQSGDGGTQDLFSGGA